MFVAATTDCFHEDPFGDALEKISHLEFSNIEVSIREDGNHLKPSQVAADLEQAIQICSSTNRLTVNSYGVEFGVEGQDYIDQFTAICALAKATRVVTVTVSSGVHGTPFNEEVERCKDLVKIAERHGVRVSVRTKVGHLSDDPDTVSVICGHVKGLGLALDPSHYLYGRDKPAEYEHLLRYVHNVYLRDSTRDQLQVRVGKGVVEYGKLINLLRKSKYNRAFCVDIQKTDDPDIDHHGEMRKLRLLLESLLIV